MNKLLTILTLVLFSLTVLVSCDDDDESSSTASSATATFESSEYMLAEESTFLISPFATEGTWILTGELANGSDTLDVTITLYQLETGTFTETSEIKVDLILNSIIYSTDPIFNEIDRDKTSMSATISTATEDEISGTITASLVKNGSLQGDGTSSDLELSFKALSLSSSLEDLFQ